MQPSSTVGRHLVWRILLIVVLISAPLQSIVPTFALAASMRSISDPSQPPDQTEVQITGPQVDAALEAAPRPDQALVVDQANPNWITRYGTEAGRQLLPPRQPDVPTTINGATPPMSGFWLTTTLQAGTNGVTAIAYAPDGRLFVALAGNGLRIYGPDVTGNYVWTSITASAGGLLSNNVNALAIFKNELWIGTAGSGISLYSLSSGTWSSLTVANSSLPNDTINRFTPVIDPNGPDYIWIGTNAGAAQYTPGRPATWNIINSADSPLIGANVYDVAVDLNGSTTTTWFATNIGLTSWNGTAFTSQGGGGCTPFFFATRVIVDRLHRVWYTPVNVIPAKPQRPNQPTGPVNEPIGLCVRTVGPLGIAVYTLYSTTTPGLPSNNVSDVSEDYAGRIWIAMRPYNSSIGGGAVYDNGTWRLYTTSSSPLPSNDVSSVLAVGEAVWWGHGNLNALTTHSPNWLRYNSAQLGGSPSALFLETTRTWAGVGGKIIYSTGGAWTSLTLPGNSDAVSSFARDANTDLWISTLGHGIYQYNGSTFTHYTTISGLPDNLVTALHSDQLGRIWAGTLSGLAMRAEAGYWLTFTTSTSPLIANGITSLARDGSERLWIGTFAGISIYDLNNPGNAWSTQTSANGLPSNTVRSVARDPSGTMWAATDAGVGAYNVISGTWTIYSSTNGLPSNDTYTVSADPAGRIWVTTRGGMALRQGTTWRTFHTPETSLESQRLTDVAADDH
ncbi:MAG TPA: two-component regulator propeller domain-containing protein, partial [Anaerolineae bacterium]|nr:two-component regulator propeller domain-containing protein [Anaerolineae bacterium]